MTKDFTVIADLKSEAITLGASNSEEALTMARAIIAEQYGQGVADDATFTIEGEGND